MSEMNLAEILQGAHVVLKLISVRLITLVALVLTAGLFAWAMYDPSTLRVIIAAIWALCCFLPVLWTGRKGSDHA
jgi:hypothetical protein